MVRMMKILTTIMIFSGFIVLCLIILTQTGFAKTITVDDDGEADYTMIQDAIDDATQGDTIRVYDGSYEENLNVDKSLTLVGNGSKETTIDGGGKGNVVGISADWVNLSGFTVTGSGDQTPDAGISVASNQVTIKNNECSNNLYGIYLESSRDCLIQNNSCYLNNREGMRIYSSSGCTIANNTSYSNVVSGILILWSNNFIIDNNNCSDSESGNGIYLSSSNNCILKNNLCHANGYGMYLHTTENILILETRSSNNYDGMRIISSRGSIIRNCIFTQSSRDSLYLKSTNNCTIIGNIIEKSKVGIYLESSSGDNVAHFNTITNLSRKGIDASQNEGVCINASENWWGDKSGPYHPTLNPEGKGSNISDYVDFEPWLEVRKPVPPVACIESISPNPAIVGETTRFEGSDEYYGQVLLYVWRSNIDGEFHNATGNVVTYSNLSMGTHTIYFKIQNDSEVWSDDVKFTLVVTDQPVAQIVSISPKIALVSESIHFQGTGTDEDGSITTFEWRSHINGEIYNGSDQDFHCSDLPLGTHDIFLKVQDNHGVWGESVEDSITIHERPVATIVSISPNIGLESDTISFSGEGTDDGNIERYVWRTDDIELHNDSSSDFSYSSFTSGSYSIFLKVQDNFGIWSTEVNTTLIIHERPVASIDLISPNPGLSTDIFHFTARGMDDGSIERYVWRTDDVELYNGPDSEFSPFPFSPGSHSIYLKVADNYGIWSEEVDTILVVNQQPTAIIELISPNPAFKNDTIYFIANGSDDRKIERYAWRTDESEFYNDTNPEFNYSAFSSGTYTIYLKVQDDYLVWSDEISDALIINERPMALIKSISPNSGLDTDAFKFIGHGTDDGTIKRYAWRIDNFVLYNGTNSEFEHSELSIGTHTIYLKVQDDRGIWSEEVTETLTIHQKPTAIINSITPAAPFAGQSVNFDGRGVDDGVIENYYWDFNNIDGFHYESQGSNTNHIFNEPGTYTVTLQVIDNDGLLGNATKKIQIRRLVTTIHDEKEDLLDVNYQKVSGYPFIDIVQIYIYDVGKDIIFQMEVNGSIKTSIPSGMYTPPVYTFLIFKDENDTIVDVNDANYKIYFAMNTGKVENTKGSTIVNNLKFEIDGSNLSITVPKNKIGGNMDFICTGSAIAFKGESAETAVLDLATEKVSDSKNDGDNHDGFLFFKGILSVYVIIILLSIITVIISVNFMRKKKGKSTIEQAQQQFSQKSVPSNNIGTIPTSSMRFQQSPTQCTSPQNLQPSGAYSNQHTQNWQCPHCGNYIGSELLFCMDCGYKKQ